MTTIYINQKPFIISNALDESQEAKFLEKQLIILHNPSPDLIPEIVHSMEEDSVYGYVWESANPDKVFQIFSSRYSHWEAAGGLITNEAGEILLMFRRGFWDLPKGKLDPCETLEECALREVKEETGLAGVYIEKKLTDTWHVYTLEDKAILKQTYWYRMSFTGNELTVPQIEEDILDIQWVRPENINYYLNHTYPNIKEVFATAGMISL